MVTEAKPTGPELPSPTEAAETAATPVEGAVVEEAPKPEGEPTPPETKPFATLADGTVWADEYEALDSPIFKPHQERREANIREQADADAATRYQGETRDWEATNVARTLAGHLGSIQEKISNDDLDGAGKVLDRLERFVEPYAKREDENYNRALMGAGANTLVGLMAHSLDRRGQDEFSDFRRKPGVSWEQLIGKFSELREARAENKSYNKGVEDGKKALLEELRAKGRTDLGPDTTPRKPGGGGAISTMDEADRRYNLPMGHPEKIGHEEYKEYRKQFGLSPQPGGR